MDFKHEVQLLPLTYSNIHFDDKEKELEYRLNSILNLPLSDKNNILSNYTDIFTLRTFKVKKKMLYNNSHIKINDTTYSNHIDFFSFIDHTKINKIYELNNGKVAIRIFFNKESELLTIEGVTYPNKKLNFNKPVELNLRVNIPLEDFNLEIIMKIFNALNEFKSDDMENEVNISDKIRIH